VKRKRRVMHCSARYSRRKNGFPSNILLRRDKRLDERDSRQNAPH